MEEEAKTGINVPRAHDHHTIGDKEQVKESRSKRPESQLLRDRSVKSCQLENCAVGLDELYDIFLDLVHDPLETWRIPRLPFEGGFKAEDKQYKYLIRDNLKKDHRLNYHLEMFNPYITKFRFSFDIWP